MQSFKNTVKGHSGIAGPWAWTLDPENTGLWTDITIQKHKKNISLWTPKFLGAKHTGPKLIHGCS